MDKDLLLGRKERREKRGTVFLKVPECLGSDVTARKEFCLKGKKTNKRRKKQKL